jgi:hypothetical protein
MDNPYQTPPPGQVYVQRTVMIDPTGAPVTLSALTERTVLTPDGQRVTEITRALPQTIEGVLLDDLRTVYRCAACGAQPLVRVMRCAGCGRATCAPCTTLIEGETVCRPCAEVPLLQQILNFIVRGIAWLRPR